MLQNMLPHMVNNIIWQKLMRAFVDSDQTRDSSVGRAEDCSRLSLGRRFDSVSREVVNFFTSR